ncbi:MAG: hypothetical protein JWP69_1501 [Flaviaesturariibacter sp.]|nr:hypothetical protein [Flaviaesturariibacter sp.]
MKFCGAQISKAPAASVYTRLTAYTPNNADAFSFSGNQAALAQVKSISAGVYGERRFLLQELSLYQAAFALPTRSGNFGLQGTYSGSASYNESGIGLAYGRNLGSKIAIGAQFNYHAVKVAGYGSAASINFEGGILFHFSESLTAGLHTYNPTGSQMGKNKEERLPAVYTAGLGYEVSEQFFISAEIQKEENQPVSVNGGMQYRFADKLFARGGFASATSAFYFGAGVSLSRFRLDVVTSVHPQLGLTPGIMLLYNGAKKEP